MSAADQDTEKLIAEARRWIKEPPFLPGWTSDLITRLADALASSAGQSHADDARTSITQPAPTEKGEDYVAMLPISAYIEPKFSPPAVSGAWDGWKLVPIEPTEAMIQAAWGLMGDAYMRSQANLVAAYTAMLAVSPPPAGDFSSCTSAATSRESK